MICVISEKEKELVAKLGKSLSILTLSSHSICFGKINEVIKYLGVIKFKVFEKRNAFAVILLDLE